MEPTACFVSSSSQNVFFTELLDAFADALLESGIAVERSVDVFPALRDGLVYVFVPHELLPFLMAEGHPSERQLQRSVTICTEQPGTRWFDEDARIARRAAAAIDINRLGVSALKKLGVESRLLQLGYVPSWDHWQGAPSKRKIALTFQGGATPRRLMALARCASQLAGRRTELHLFESTVPHQPDSEHFLSGSRKWDMLGNSQLLMNIHRSELGYLEWQRAVGAMVNGCVFFSEHSLGFEPLVPGEHFVSVSFDSLDAALGGLLDDPDELDKIRLAAYRFLRQEHPLSSSIHVLAETIQEVARTPLPMGRLNGHEVRPMPKPPQQPPAEYERLMRERGELDVLRMATKQVLLEQRQMGRSLRALEQALTGKVSRSDHTEEIGPSLSTPPRVSVVLTVYNYASLVAGAIASVADSELTDYELVIVDDASSDGSGEVIRLALQEAPWVSCRLITRAVNGGLASARNLGARSASAELLFMLDADNLIYPHALARLADALDAKSDATFAYGIIEQFGMEGPSSLMSYLGWDPRRLRYGNFVDAMAMLRRSALLEVGGYTDDSRLYGWEDFALWCAFAERGWTGVRVPEIVARYRVAPHSMISLTNIDAAAAWSALLDRYPCLSVSAASSALAAGS